MHSYNHKKLFGNCNETADVSECDPYHISYGIKKENEKEALNIAMLTVGAFGEKRVKGA